MLPDSVVDIRNKIPQQSQCFSDHNLSQRLSQVKNVAGMLWHVTWFTLAHVTNRFPPHSLEKDVVTASKSLRSLKH